MREIKFRAWSKSNGCFCSAFSIHMSGKISDMIDAKIDKDSGLAISDAHWGENDLEIMQFTGILDKNDVKIYEGDIVKVHSYSVTGLGKVWFNKGSFVFNKFEYPTSQVLHSFSEIEIVGNVFENPELLEMK